MEWAEEFVGLDSVTATAVLERIKDRYDRPPSIKQIRSAVVAEKNATERAIAHAKALSWSAAPASVDEPTTFAEWAVTDPVRARKLVGALEGKSYVRAELEEVIAKGTEIFDALATDREPTVEERYTWSHYDPPCDRCHRPVENGPNAQSRYDRDTDTWTNAHIDCSIPNPALRGT